MLDMLDICTEPTSICSPSVPLSIELNSISLAPLLPKLPYLAMLFILQLIPKANSAGQLMNKHHAQIGQYRQ